MLAFVLYALLGWFAFNLIFRFIIPVYKTTRQMKKKFREMNDRAREEQARQQDFNQPSPTQKPAPTPRREDYIDFEEIK